MSLLCGEWCTAHAQQNDLFWLLLYESACSGCYKTLLNRPRTSQYLATSMGFRLRKVSCRVSQSGKIEEYDGTKEDWPQYVERCRPFFYANGMTDANVNKKKSVFLAVIGPPDDLWSCKKSCGTHQVRGEVVRGVGKSTNWLFQPHPFGQRWFNALTFIAISGSLVRL